MACSSNRNGRCRRCGRLLNNNNNRAVAAEEAARQAAFTNRDGGCICIQPGSIAEELYTCAAPVDVYRECCDPYIGCHEFNLANRNSFWPSFAHPRWLGCQQLYGRGRNL